MGQQQKMYWSQSIHHLLLLPYSAIFFSQRRKLVVCSWQINTSIILILVSVMFINYLLAYFFHNLEIDTMLTTGTIFALFPSLRFLHVSPNLSVNLKHLWNYINILWWKAEAEPNPKKTEGSWGPAFTVYIRTENEDQASFCPSVS